MMSKTVKLHFNLKVIFVVGMLREIILANLIALPVFILV
jgi:hypothetical protein